VTSEDVRGELDKVPFLPFRIHLVSGKTLEVPHAGAAWMLRNTVLVFQVTDVPRDPPPYDIVSLRNIERLERLSGGLDKE
jgi:hypothetical protein